ncbi:HET-domain-containing protein, partial [Lizonia empirigonia]
WITECVNSHQECDDKTSHRRLILKIIDCLKREVCIASAGAAYVCLSYVWGTESDLEQPSHGTLGVLSRTVEDAIYATQELGFRYLWIDRYCIDQANEAEKHDTINNMDIIYQGADLTIVAAAGDGPHTGLPGILSTPRCPQQTVTIGRTQHIVIEDHVREIRKSLWYTRGWTYQEMLLSRRCLVFTPSQVYFQC